MWNYGSAYFIAGAGAITAAMLLPKIIGSSAALAIEFLDAAKTRFGPLTYLPSFSILASATILGIGLVLWLTATSDYGWYWW